MKFEFNLDTDIINNDIKEKVKKQANGIIDSMIFEYFKCGIKGFRNPGIAYQLITERLDSYIVSDEFQQLIDKAIKGKMPGIIDKTTDAACERVARKAAQLGAEKEVGIRKD